MSTILEKANEILAEKEAKILPENIKSGVKVFNVTGTIKELIGQEKTATAGIENLDITPDEGYTGLTKVTVLAVDSSVDSNIIAENIREGVTILGVEGAAQVLDTTDATATADDLILNKTAYVNGEKITGTIIDKRNIGAAFGAEKGNDTTIYVNDDEMLFEGNTMLQADALSLDVTNVTVINGNTTCSVYLPAADVATAIGLTADVIKEGTTILGITGTYTGGTDNFDDEIWDEEV